jgi:hypothetical protein
MGPPALPENITPVRKGLPGTNTLAYFAAKSAMKKKSFITLTPFLFC